MGVLSVVTFSHYLGRSAWPINRLAAFLDVGPNFIEAVVKIGPSRLFFDLTNRVTRADCLPHYWSPF